MNKNPKIAKLWVTGHAKTWEFQIFSPRNWNPKVIKFQCFSLKHFLSSLPLILSFQHWNLRADKEMKKTTHDDCIFSIPCFYPLPAFEHWPDGWEQPSLLLLLPSGIPVASLSFSDLKFHSKKSWCLKLLASSGASQFQCFSLKHFLSSFPLN